MKTKTKILTRPALESDGRCSACRGWRVCDFHRAEAVAEEAKKSAVLRAVVISGRQVEAARYCARYELESDEGGTRQDKAAQALGFESFAALSTI